MLEQQMPRPAGIRLTNDIAHAGDSRRLRRESIEIRVHLQSTTMALAHCDFQRIVRWSAAEVATEKHGARLDVRSIERVARRTRLKVDDVEVRSRSGFHDARDLRFGVVIEARHPECASLGRRRRPESRRY